MLQPKLFVCPASDNTALKLFDITGLYNSLNATGGYGGGVNPDISDVSAAFIEIKLPLSDTIIQIAASPTFPTYDEETPFIVTNIMLGVMGALVDGVYSITYRLQGTFNNASFDITGNSLYLLSSSTQCCLLKKTRDLSTETTNCDNCDNSDVNAVANMWVLLSGAIANADCGKKNKAQKTIDYVYEICTNGQPCKDC